MGQNYEAERHISEDVHTVPDSFLCRHEKLSSIVSTNTLRKTVCRLQSPANSLKLFLRVNMCGLSLVRIQQHARKLMKSN